VRPDYVDKNMPTRIDEQVDVRLQGVVLGDVVPR
jgi:pyrimidine operon attenuation protein/uracil phosphoribosyltransferase